MSRQDSYQEWDALCHKKKTAREHFLNLQAPFFARGVRNASGDIISATNNGQAEGAMEAYEAWQRVCREMQILAEQYWR